eukprot:365617-Chlamydomonas_euryale.AAC.11
MGLAVHACARATQPVASTAAATRGRVHRCTAAGRARGSGKGGGRIRRRHAGSQLQGLSRVQLVKGHL